MNRYERPICAILLVSAACCVLSGCGDGLHVANPSNSGDGRHVANQSYSGDDLHVSNLATSGRHGELITFVQAKLDRGERVGDNSLCLLCDAYYKTRRYHHVFRTADLIANEAPTSGDKHVDYSLAPYIYRAKAYVDIGDYVMAAEQGTAGYDLLHQDGRLTKQFGRFMQIEILGVQGIAHALAGHGGKADICVQRLWQVGLEYPHQLLGVNRQLALARIHLAGREFGKALTAIQHPVATKSRGLMLEGQVDWTFEEMPKAFVLSKCLYETGDTGKAKKRYDKLLAHSRIDQFGGMHWIILLDRGRIARAEGQSAKAVDLLRRAVDVIERQRSSIHTETAKIGFVGDKQAVYQELVSLLVERGEAADAFEYAERAKARALVDLLAGQKQLTDDSEEGKQLNAKVTQLARAETESLVLPDAKDNGADSRTRGVVIGLKKELTAKTPELASLVTVTGTSTTEIQGLLAADEALVEYFRCGKDWYAFLVTSKDIAAEKLKAPGLSSLVSRFHQAISNRASTDCRQHGQALYGRLIRPLAERLKQKKLLIVPHGALHYVPFAALHDEGKYLIDGMSLRMLPSASVLKFLKARKAGGALVLGNPDLGNPKFDLKHAQAEAAAIAKTLAPAKLLVRRQATETFVKDRGRQFGTLHIAAHGTFDPDQPLNSALLLARDATNDGQLRVAELYTLRLNADLVTLSGCETALGTVANGDDVVGFTRGLLYAGASSIVSSLWKVDDAATRDLMVAFYKGLSKHDKAEALRQAQLAIRKRHPHPYYWAAFALTGRAQ